MRILLVIMSVVISSCSAKPVTVDDLFYQDSLVKRLVSNEKVALTMVLRKAVTDMESGAPYTRRIYKVYLTNQSNEFSECFKLAFDDTYYYWYPNKPQPYMMGPNRTWEIGQLITKPFQEGGFNYTEDLPPVGKLSVCGE